MDDMAVITVIELLFYSFLETLSDFELFFRIQWQRKEEIYWESLFLSILATGYAGNNIILFQALTISTWFML